MTSSYLTRRLRSEQEARDDIWNAVDSWSNGSIYDGEEIPYGGIDAPRAHPAEPVEMWDALWRRALLERLAREFGERRRKGDL